ncbi:uncharacterized protein [Oryza sativa Japonica Group]|uniref:uncharacterized protein n=1 Tax=Oryza sativa subsp. japonica TaxID=39947 RepID=UPI00339BC2A8
MALPIARNGRAIPGRLPWPPAVFPVTVPPSPMPGSLPSPIKWNPLRAFYRFSPFPSSPVAAPPLPASSFSSLGAGHPPAACAASPVRRLTSPPPSSASQVSPLRRPALRFARGPSETRPRWCTVALPPLYHLQPPVPHCRSVGFRRRCLSRHRNAVLFPGQATASPVFRRNTVVPRRPLHPPRRNFPGRSRRHLLRPRSGKVSLGLASPPSEPLRCPSSSSPFVLNVDVPSVARHVVSLRRHPRPHRSSAFHAVLVSVQPLPAALVASSPIPVVVLSSFPVVVAFVPPSSRSRPLSASVKCAAAAPSSSSSSPPHRQALRRPRLAFVQGSPPKSSPRLSSPSFPAVSAALVRRCRSLASSRGGL